MVTNTYASLTVVANYGKPNQGVTFTGDRLTFPDIHGNLVTERVAFDGTFIFSFRLFSGRVLYEIKGASAHEVTRGVFEAARVALNLPQQTL